MTVKKKVLVTLAAFACVAAIVTISVLSTIAYFTSSAVISNTFTIGSVGITMNEAKVNNDGTLFDGGTTRVEGNSYHLVPGHTYIKDPIITVKAKSEQSFLFIMVRNDIKDIEIAADAEVDETETIAEQLYTLGWREYTEVSTGKVYVYCGNLGTPVETDAPNFTPVGVGGLTDVQVKLFDNFSIAGNANITDTFNAATITIRAFAVQTKGFKDSEPGDENFQYAHEKAWAALLAAYPYIHTPTP